MIIPRLSCFLLLIRMTNSAMEPFITGGQHAKIENFPHSVFLYLTCNKEPQTCGGAILTQDIILTAGHCFEQCFFKNDVIEAYAGSENTQEMIVSDRMSKFRIHKHYDPKLFLNDIALGLLDSALPLGRTMKRVIIARNFPGVTMATIAGWGVIDDKTLEQTDKLKMVTQIIQPTATCIEVANLRTGMFCATNSDKNRPTQGDSGSALVSKTGQEVGLVSWRLKNRKDVVVYTNVSYYYDWIMAHAKRLHCTE